MVATENPSAAGVERERFGLPAWGKYDKTTGRIHRLEHHCADVAACFEALVRDPVLRARFAQAAGGSFTATTAARLAVLAFLHDFGKLNSGFQFKVPRPVAASECSPSRAGHIGEALLCIDRPMERLYPASARVETVLAVPGYLRVGEVEGKRAGRFDVSWDDDPDDEKKRQSRWSAESARKFLSAPTGVGTVDQALLAGLRVKWAHFRGSALARSLLVVDEVHASDAYMTELLLGVLRSHLALGGHAVLMSATLGAVASAKLVSNASGCSAPTPKDALGVRPTPP